MTVSNTPEVIQDCGVTIVALGTHYENLEDHLLDLVRTVVLDRADKADPPRVLLDLSHTKYFGSAFIEVLFRAWNRLECASIEREADEPSSSLKTNTAVSGHVGIFL